jgi:hypothetical protein
LTLFVLGHFANHPHNSVALDDLALIANLLNTCPYLHDSFALPNPSINKDPTGWIQWIPLGLTPAQEEIIPTVPGLRLWVARLFASESE